MAWGVFGTNLNRTSAWKTRLNGRPVAFLLEPLYQQLHDRLQRASRCRGGDLFVENTTRHNSGFIASGPVTALVDGRIRLRGCTLRPNGGQRVGAFVSPFQFRFHVGIRLASLGHRCRRPVDRLQRDTFNRIRPAISGDTPRRPIKGRACSSPNRSSFATSSSVQAKSATIRIPDPRHYDLRHRRAMTKASS